MYLKITKTAYREKPTNWGEVTQELKEAETLQMDFETLAKYIKKGHSFILANFDKDAKDIRQELIKDVPAIALDIDSKEKPIQLNQLVMMIKDRFNIIPTIAYTTFNDIDGTRFRLIYAFDSPISIEEYKLVYKGLLTLYGDYLDHQTTNCNRAWAGTNKRVLYSNKGTYINQQIRNEVISLIQTKPKKEFIKKVYNCRKVSNSLLDKFFIKKEYKDYIMQLLVDSIPLEEFISEKFGGEFKRYGSRLMGACPIHGGDNKTALSIYTDTNSYTCFTRCGTGNIVTLAYLYYNTNDFSYVALSLMNEYKIDIPDDAIGIKKEVK